MSFGSSARFVPFVIVNLALAALMPSSKSAAQDEQVWIVVVAATNPADAERTAESMINAGAVLQSAGNTVIEPEHAATTVESEISQPFQPAPNELDTRVGQIAESTLESVALGDNEEALQAAEPLLTEIDPYLAALGRNDRTAVDILNLCLYMARARLQLGQNAEARRQVHVCARLVPDLPVDERVHPPEVRNLVNEVRNEIEGSSSLLSVQAAPSDPGSCIIRINGRRMGTAGGVRRALPPGSYAIQAECDPARAGRIHPVMVEEGTPTRVVVNAQLSERLATRPILALTYRSGVELQANVAGDIARLAAAVDANRVLAAVDDGRTLVFRTYEIRPEGPQLRNSRPQPRPLVLNEEVINQLARGEVIGDERTSESGPNPASVGIGSTMVVLGVAGIGVAWGFWVDLDAAWLQLTVEHEMSENYGPTIQRAQTARWTVLGASLGGSALVTAGIPFLLPTEREVPVWSWILGGVGVAAIGGGIGAMFAEPRPIVHNMAPGMGTETFYTQESEPAFLGTLILAHGIPLVSIPLTHLIRQATGSNDAPTMAMSVDHDSMRFRVQGTF